MSLHFEDVVASALENPPPGTIYLASVSGGADSTALLVALASLGERFRIRCIHVEHGIRPGAESRGDAEFVRSLCAGYDIPCRVVSVRPGKIARTAERRGVGIEAAARLYRHRAWSLEAERLEAASGGRETVRVLVAHTADDMLETVLMRVLRGAGPAGLAAMPARRGRILRPLLALGRRDVLSYLAQKGVPWREDSTNTDTRHLRNRVRHRLVPTLADAFPGWRTALSSLARTQSLAADFIATEAGIRVGWQPFSLAESFTRKSALELRTDEDNFFAQPAIVREEALFQGIDALLAGSGRPSAIGHEIRRSNVRRFSEGKLSAADLGRVRLRRKNGAITISGRENTLGFTERKAAVHEYGFSLLIITPGFYTLKGMAVEVGGGDTGESVFFATLPLVLRPALGGDRIGGVRGSGFGDGEVVSAVDSLGIAAFIGANGLLGRRYDAPRMTNESLCAVKVKTERGKNVQRAKRR